ncbi:MAG: tRNA 2-thiouridine(34) synthase MnmA [Tannerellaceae bacterium]|jgi:tRNA-specific 2-thiouridylase|nr:tRNA 2-thiouridine(34) synthase MnmA [Tannerellaceae bacterium]
MSTKKTVFVAMSGGVDSSVSAYKMLQEGHNVIGVTLDMKRKGDQEAVDDARIVADKLKIEHIVLNTSDDYKDKVLEYFKNSYIGGETPNPCVMCNRFVKFKFLIDLMREKGGDFIATGHYARIINSDGEFKLFRAKNLKKDQSYFLSYINKEYLQYIKFPLGDVVSKDDVRRIASEIGLHNALKHDSQDICFIDTDYKDFLKKNDVNFKKGLIKHVNGEILGKHDGIINYTIGQRRGLGIAYEKPIYVVKIDAADNVVYVGDEEDLFNRTFKIRNLNALGDIDGKTEYTFKLRSTHIGQNGFINLDDMTVTLNEGSRAITKGQLCVMYNGEQVVGSGWIV